MSKTKRVPLSVMAEDTTLIIGVASQETHIRMAWLLNKELMWKRRESKQDKDEDKGEKAWAVYNYETEEGYLVLMIVIKNGPPLGIPGLKNLDYLLFIRECEPSEVLGPITKRLKEIPSVSFVQVIPASMLKNIPEEFARCL